MLHVSDPKAYTHPHLLNSRGSLGSGSRLNTRRRLGTRESADNAGGSGQNNNGGLGEHFEECVFCL